MMATFAWQAASPDCFRLIAIRWRTVALAANSACKISFGKSIARRTPLVLIWRQQPLAFTVVKTGTGESSLPVALAERPYEDKALPLGKSTSAFWFAKNCRRVG